MEVPTDVMRCCRVEEKINSLVLLQVSQCRQGPTHGTRIPSDTQTQDRWASGTTVGFDDYPET
jgi:hypothetical protein